MSHSGYISIGILLLKFLKSVMAFQQAPPPMASSPEQDSFVDLSMDPKPAAQAVAMVSIYLLNNSPPCFSLKLGFDCLTFCVILFYLELNTNHFYVMLQKMENVVKNEELADSLVKKEGVIVEEKIKTVGEKRGLKLDFEKPNRNVQQKLLPKATISKVETTGNSKLELGVQGG